MKHLLRLALFALFAAGPLAAAPAQPWAQLKVGMSADDALDLLGDPVCSRRGHGFFTWIYDEGAEVLLYGEGKVVGWTLPGATENPGPSRDIWSSQPAGKYYATMHAVLPRPAKTRATPGAPKADGIAPRAAAGTGYEEYAARSRPHPPAG